jgi:hypothetical protein
VSIEGNTMFSGTVHELVVEVQPVALTKGVLRPADGRSNWTCVLGS